MLADLLHRATPLVALLAACGVMVWVLSRWRGKESKRQVTAMDRLAQEEPELIRSLVDDIGAAFLEYSQRVALFLCRIDRSLLTPGQQQVLEEHSARLVPLGFRFVGCVAWCRFVEVLRRVAEPTVGLIFVSADGIDRLLVFSGDAAVLGYEAESETLAGEFLATTSSTLSASGAVPAVTRHIMPAATSLEDLLAQHRHLHRSALRPVTTMEEIVSSQRRQEVANWRALLQRGIPDEFLDDPEVDVRGILMRSWPIGVSDAARTIFERQVRIALMSWRPSARQLDAVEVRARAWPEWYAPPANGAPLNPSAPPSR